MGSIESFYVYFDRTSRWSFPVWLSPVQAVILPISDKHLSYAQDVARQADEMGLRVEVNTNNESLSKKIRNAQKAKVPYMLVVGDKEIEDGTVAVRQRAQKAQEIIDSKEFLERLALEVEKKS